jgi:sterol desaturase/sphingolipid hydroxylase (fatty acid hydroxylase superfamily)
LEEFLLFAKLALVQLVRYGILAGGVYLLIFRWAPGFFKKYKIQNTTVSSNQIKHEISYSLSTVLIFGFVFFLMMQPDLRAFTKLYGNISDYPEWWYFLSLPVIILIHDTYFYWMHRSLHNRFLYKLAHQTHHVSLNPTPFATYSFHPIEAIFEAAWILPLVYLVPIHKHILLVFSLITFLNNLKGHLGVDLMPATIKRAFPYKWVNTSTHHSHHHKYFNVNYGLYFLFWDKIMKTEKSYK